MWKGGGVVKTRYKTQINNHFHQAITLAKTCESTTEMRECRSPRDWSLLALQNTRTGKSHYLVICRCPDNFILGKPEPEKANNAQS